MYYISADQTSLLQVLFFFTILHKHCFRFLLGLTIVPRENKILMKNFGGTNKEYYGIFESGLLQFVAKTCVDMSQSSDCLKLRGWHSLQALLANSNHFFS